MSMKNSSDTSRNRARDLPNCSTMPQLTALPCAPHLVHITVKIITGQNRNILFSVAGRKMMSFHGVIAVASI